MVASAMAGENAIHCALFYLIAEIIELRICQLIEMETTDEGIDVLSAESQPDIFQNVCHAGMRTAAEYDQTGRRVKDKALLMGKAVRIVGFVFSDIEVVALGNRGIICRTVGDQPYAAGDFMDSGNIPDAVLKLLEKAFFDPDILHDAFFQAKTVLTAAFPNKKWRGFVQRKESIHSVGVIIMSMRQNTEFDT